MAQTIPLKLVIDMGSGSEFYDSVSDSDIVNAWPGTPITFDLTNPPQLIQPVFIGVSEDGSSSQVYSAQTPVADILLAGWIRVYQGTEIQDADGNVLVFSDQYNHVLLAIAACCNTQILTQALALKLSSSPLIPGEVYGCGVEAIFKWLAVFGSNEVTPSLTYSFRVALENQAGDVLINETFVLAEPFTETVQEVKRWPDDFIGMTIGSTTLVANDATPGVGERRVSDFDNGTITVQVDITDGDEYNKTQQSQFSLPGTDCASSDSSSEDSGIFESSFSDSFS